MAWAQDARLLVEDGPQYNVGIDESLHQDVGLAVLTECHGASGALILVVAIDVDRLYEPHLLSFLYCVTGAGIVGANHCYTLAVSPLLQEDNHVVQSLNRLHR